MESNPHGLIRAIQANVRKKCSFYGLNRFYAREMDGIRHNLSKSIHKHRHIIFNHFWGRFWIQDDIVSQVTSCTINDDLQISDVGQTYGWAD